MSNLVSLPTMQMPPNPRTDLLSMLSLRRPAFSTTENRFINHWLMPLPGAEMDHERNVIVRVGDSKVLWSSHTDTVHRRDGYQAYTVRDERVLVKGKSNCLGADCTTGVWLMREMILANVPGLYIFHAGEERGGIGSSAIAEKNPELLKGIDFAIAFDRRGTDEVITHQMSGRTASDEFARSIAKMLPGKYEPSPDGTFTDTSNYSKLIPECSNISVGYDFQHTRSEFQCLKHALKLRDAMLGFDETKLVKARDPSIDDYDYDCDWVGRYLNSKNFKYHKYGSTLVQGADGVFRRETFRNAKSISEFVMLYPEATADYLAFCGFNLSDLYKSAPDLP